MDRSLLFALSADAELNEVAKVEVKISKREEDNEEVLVAAPRTWIQDSGTQAQILLDLKGHSVDLRKLQRILFK